jgi:hypothetical protein
MFAQRTVRRLPRGREKERIAVHTLDGPLSQQAMAEWGDPCVYRALDTSMWWHTDGLVRLSLGYRGRAIPLVWTGREHPRRRVADHRYHGMRDQVAARRPVAWTVVFTADRGFADTHLMAPVARLGWQWRMRIKGSCGVDRQGKRRCNVTRLP